MIHFTFSVFFSSTKIFVQACAKFNQKAILRIGSVSWGTLAMLCPIAYARGGAVQTLGFPRPILFFLELAAGETARSN
jgi:uncharacterized membrane protein AbrB (regulator of aidB expression)